MTIKQRQLLLAYLGYYVGEIDGKWGQLSRVACEAFQKDFGGLTVDGNAGPETQKALKHAVAYGIVKKEEPVVKTDFWADIKYFDRDEFKCKCGKYCNGFPVEPKEKLVRAAEKVRNHFGVPVNLSSGVRCDTHNANVGGVSGSRHRLGKAMDFRVSGKKSSEVLAYVKTLPEIRYTYAINDNYVHMDIQ